MTSALQRLAALLTISTASLLAACSSGPSVSGLGLGNRRIVSVDDVVEIRLPLRSDDSRNWRVSDYDSGYLTLAERPIVTTKADGTREVVIRARPRQDGKTTIEITEVLGRREAASRTPRVEQFVIRIVK